MLHSESLLWGVLWFSKYHTLHGFDKKNEYSYYWCEQDLFNTALLHRLIFRVHSEHYQAGNFIFVVLVGQGWSHVQMMHLAKVIRCGEL